MEQQSGRLEPSTEQDVRGMIRNVIEEFLTTERRKAEPAYKAELLDERKRREQLERQVCGHQSGLRRPWHVAERHPRTGDSEVRRVPVSAVNLVGAKLGLLAEILVASRGRKSKDERRSTPDIRDCSLPRAGDLGLE
jgi:hypothetical protein